jgi:1,4-dihydroxy-2-naphthoyl-CoA synthase
MQNDINTFGCTQWFFFRVVNQDKMKATFFINNFYKSHSLYQIGMKIIIFSMKKFMNEGVGWVRGGEEIAYFKNGIT